MNGKDEAGTRWAMLVELDCGAFQHFSVASWNEFVGELVRRNMTPIAWSLGRRPTPVGVMFDFRGLRGARRPLAGIDLTFCDLGNACFEGALLDGSKLGSCPGANLRNARLKGTAFRGDVSGCAFTGAEEAGNADFHHAYFFADRPPTGLPAEALAACEVLPSSVDDADQIPPVPAETVLRARATITEVPW